MEKSVLKDSSRFSSKALMLSYTYKAKLKIQELAMSRCYFLKTDYCVDFIGMQETLEMLHHEYITAYKELEPSAGERSVACFYILETKWELLWKININ